MGDVLSQEVQYWISLFPPGTKSVLHILWWSQPDLSPLPQPFQCPIEDSRQFSQELLHQSRVALVLGNSHQERNGHDPAPNAVIHALHLWPIVGGQDDLELGRVVKWLLERA